MPTPIWTRIVIGLAAGLWLLLALVLNVPVDQNWLKTLAGIASGVVFLLLIFDLWLWRFLPMAITGRPDLRGTWKARLDYQPVHGGEIESKECFVVIRQTYSEISVCMLFDISTSVSRSAAMVESDGRRTLWFSYWSSAEALARDDNPPHRGAAELTISVKPQTRFQGDYWTERQTRGRIVAEGRSKHLYDDFESARSGAFA